MKKYCYECGTLLEEDRLPLPKKRMSINGNLVYGKIKWIYYLWCPKCRRLRHKIKKNKK
jgi:hypothetical protein